MKQLFFSLSLFLMTINLQAQDRLNIDKGTWMVGGQVSFTSIQGKRGTELNLSPEAGYFIANRFALTLGATFSIRDNGLLRTRRFILQPGVRAYLYKGLFAAANVGFGSTRFSTSDPSIMSSTNNLFSWETRVGYSFFLNKYVAIEPALYYYSQRLNGYNTRTLNLSIGFRVFL